MHFMCHQGSKVVGKNGLFLFQGMWKSPSKAITIHPAMQELKIVLDVDFETNVVAKRFSSRAGRYVLKEQCLSRAFQDDNLHF